MRALALALLAAALFTGCRRQAAHIPIDPALATLAPHDTVFLAGIRFDKIRGTSVYRQFIEQRRIPELDRFARETGLDPRKDIWEFLIAFNGRQALVMARGKFAPAGLEPKLEREGARRFAYKGYTFLGDEHTAVTFMNATTALAGPTALVRSIIDQRDRTGGGIPRGLRERIDALPAASQVWAVGDVAGRLPSSSGRGSGARLEGNYATLARLIETVRYVSAALDLRSGLQGRVTLESTSEADADRLNSAIRGLVGMGRLSTPSDQPELLRFFDGFKTERHGNGVVVDLNIPADLIDDAARLLERRQ